LAVIDFARGSLHRTSYARPGKLFTANRNLPVRQIAALNSAASERVITAVIHLLLPRRES
jgi:mRNA interferase MazF